MTNHEEILLACRAQLETLSVATSGSITVEATTTGYTRSSGSFLTDGFAPGQEIAGTGFSASANNATKTITQVTALIITCAGNSAEAAASRTLSVGVPDVASENIEYEPTTGQPYFEESYLPGPGTTATLGPLAQLEPLPVYILRVFVAANIGKLGIDSYTDALLTLFAPGQDLSVSGQTIRVRKDVNPSVSQVLPLSGGVFASVTIPLRVRTANAI